MKLFDTDVLVIGAGLSGLRAAIEAARTAKVLIVSADLPHVPTSVPPPWDPDSPSTEARHDVHQVLIYRVDVSRGCSVGVTRSGETVGFRFKACVLAAGGGAQVFRQALSGFDSFGGSYVLAHEAGAKLQDLEFFEIVPQVDPAVWAQRPKILDARGRDHSKEIPENAWTARATHRAFTMNDGSGVIDIALAQAAERGGARIQVNGREHAVSLAVGAFYGGCVIDETAQTTVPGLFACGEAARSAISEDPRSQALVFGKRAGENAARVREGSDAVPEPEHRVNVAQGLSEGELENYAAMVRDLATSKALVVRRLDDVRDSVGIPVLVNRIFTEKGVRDPKLLWRYYEVRTMARFAELLFRAILARPKTTGPHYVIET